LDNFAQFYNVEPDAKRLAWVVERCIGPKHTLHTILPSGFAGYTRICHPGWSVSSLEPDDEKAWAALSAGWPEAENLAPVRWHDVAVANNHTPHRLMQWFQICSPTSRVPGMAGVDSPFEGDMTKEMVGSLYEILTDHSGANQEVLCGFWEGFNRTDYRAKAKFESYPGQQNYLLFNSTLSKVRDGWLAALEHVYRHYHHSMETVGLAPSAVWPTTGDWYLTVPYNRPSSYFGGSADLVSRICRAGDLETYKALPGDDIWQDDRSKAFLKETLSS
jgi:hypothetical protein